MKTIMTICLLILTLKAQASTTYYPNSSLEKFSSLLTTQSELREEIFNLSAQIHIVRTDSNDTLSDNCPEKEKCISQKTNLTYLEARKIMFGQLFMESHGNGKYSIKDSYCNINVTESQGVGPGKIPDPKIMNCEHTWPQSKFSKEFPTEIQKTDLHHLFPVNMRANSTRNNFPFAEVNGVATHVDCQDSKIGNSLNTNVRAFEPPVEHKGNVARAIYYFSTRYKMNIDETQSRYLKIWNEEDPVDQEEQARNELISKIQGNRNPFVDFPELVNRL